MSTYRKFRVYIITAVPVVMGTSDDSAHLPLAQYVLHGYHCNGHPVHRRASRGGWGGVAIRYPPQGH